MIVSAAAACGQVGDSRRSRWGEWLYAVVVVVTFAATFHVVSMTLERETPLK